MRLVFAYRVALRKPPSGAPSAASSERSPRDGLPLSLHRRTRDLRRVRLCPGYTRRSASGGSVHFEAVIATSRRALATSSPLISV